MTTACSVCLVCQDWSIVAEEPVQRVKRISDLKRSCDQLRYTILPHGKRVSIQYLNINFYWITLLKDTIAQ